MLKSHWAEVPNLGDIRNIKGNEIEPVDIVTFGSPCQNLSISGNREGLDGEMSGLFREAVRIIREMREASNGKYPRYAIWENVPGAFSSNQGKDFRTVLEEITETSIPMPTSGRWSYAGMVRTERIEVSWRVFDSQYWGVPQRRRRIYLVADFGGQCAHKILFEPSSLSRNITESRSKRKDITSNTGTGFATTSKPRVDKEVAQCLTTRTGCRYDAETETLIPVEMVIEPRSQDGLPRIHNNICPTLNTAQGGQRTPCIIQPRSYVVRRLTPLETLRLQSFPDNWFDCGGADTAKYKAIGNSITVNIAQYIMQRIMEVGKVG